MKCLLLWATINVYLYRCPNLMTTPFNCTKVHSGTYDQEFIALCNELIETTTTTDQSSMVAYTTTSTESPQSISTSTVSQHQSGHEGTTTSTRSSTPGSGNPIGATTTVHSPTPKQRNTPVGTTTPRLGGSPSGSFGTIGPQYIPPNETTVVHKTIVNEYDPAMTIIAICLSVFSIFGCVVLSIWIYKKQKELKVHKMIRPSQVDIEISPTSTKPLVNNRDARNSWAKRPHTSRPMMSKRPSEVKKLTLDDWRNLQKQIHTRVPPPVNRSNKPPVPTLDLEKMPRRDASLMAPRREPPQVPNIPTLSIDLSNGGHVKRVVDKIENP
jgi:hypothetical protein